MKKIILSALVLSSLVMSEDIDFTESNKLMTHTEFGYISTSGNTETKTYALEAKLTKGFEKNLFALTFDGQYAEDTEVETKNKYFIELQYDYSITEKFSFNYLVGYKQDKFSGFNYQAYTGPGAKYKAIVSEAHNLSLDGNILYSEDDIEDVNLDLNGEVIAYPNPTDIPTASTTAGTTEDYTSVRIKAVYDWQVLSDLRFTQEASYRADTSDTENYFIYSKTAFSSKISDIFSAGISYKIDYVNLPAEGKEDADKTLTATLTIDY